MSTKKDLVLRIQQVCFRTSARVATLNSYKNFWNKLNGSSSFLLYDEKKKGREKERNVKKYLEKEGK